MVKAKLMGRVMSDETQITPTTPIAPTPNAVTATRDVVPKPTPTPQPSSDNAATSSDAPAKPQAAPVFALSLQFDADTHRLIIEARNPLSGAIVFQVPSKSALQALTQPAKSAVSRGKSVNSEA
jgi:hypothetical protein